ncbi:MAG: type III toxin-antitoxin system ToxN/AbiQ family toxin [Coprobacillus sp.]|nr:type III toxin-antitoxin system ToxN/AbiQ family toxin [Coprobacillus sp.]
MEIKFKDFAFYTADTDYLRYLYSFDHEVFYKNYGYEHKPFLGIIVGVGDYNYFIPLTSAKPSHSKWPLVSRDSFLIYQKMSSKEKLSKTIYKNVPGDPSSIYRIYGALILHKMIPIPSGAYKKIDLYSLTDKNYQYLLQREFSFCYNIKEEIVGRVRKIYEAQIKTGHIRPRYVNFKALETACDNYKK